MSIPELADILLAQIEGKLAAVPPPGPTSASGYSPILGQGTKDPIGSTLVLLPQDEFSLGSKSKSKSEVEVEREGRKVLKADLSLQIHRFSDQEISRVTPAPDEKASSSDAEPPPEVTQLASSAEEGGESIERTHIESYDDAPLDADAPVAVEKQIHGVLPAKVQQPITPSHAEYRGQGRDVTDEPTVVLERMGSDGVPTRKRFSDQTQGKLKKTLIICVTLLIAQDLLFEDDEPASGAGSAVKVEAIRPKLPRVITERAADPAKSQTRFKTGLKYFDLDTVPGYTQASENFLAAAALDSGNVQALAMLASSYLNLIDSSNKDENYFTVISKLIEMSRAKSIDLPETVGADVEFYLVANRSEAAKQRIVEYTKANRNFDPVMFFHIAQVFLARNDLQGASRYINLYPENQVKSARIFHFRGLLAERFGDDESALREYLRALKLNSRHAKSKLRIAELYNKRARLRDASAYLKFLAENPSLLAPKDLARAYYLISLHQQIEQRWDRALTYIERALRLDRHNHDYLFEFYTMRARVGNSVKGAKREAQMYMLMSQGEKLLANGLQHEALSKFLEARQTHIDSPAPLVKIGDMFLRLNEIANARMNYQIAAEKAPKNISIWTKYIDVLIQSYEWEEAQKAMDRFRKLPVSQSAVDKAAGDLYARQGQHPQAQALYRKAMARETIDPTVYIAYANSLMATGKPADAPFFFALALRFDPLNTEATIGTARCIAQTDSIDRAISMLNDELQRASAPRAELLSAIAEFEGQKGDWESAQRFVDQAKAANPDFAAPWRIQAQIHLSRESTDKKALDRALEAYKSYSDRNASDPSGYLERYRIFAKKTEYEKAAEELGRIYTLFPKYPNLHLFKGTLYGLMGNHKVAVEEFILELKNNPNAPAAMVALGKSLIQDGKLREALEQFQRAMIVAPNQPDPKHQAAYANFLLKNYSGAIALYQSALALDRGNPLIHKGLGMVYRAMGDQGAARQAFRKYIEMEPDAPDKAEFQQFL